MILLDIGNRHAHIWKDGRVEHLLVDEAIDRYREEKSYYICVNRKYSSKLNALRKWINLSDKITINGEYSGLGVDRKALCLSRGDGVYVDAGSAITVDKVLNGRYIGGYILPGIHSYRKAYTQIAPVLDVELKHSIDTAVLPRSTDSGVSYGTIVPIISSINMISGILPIYFTGGDGEWLSRYFTKAIYSDKLLFEGIRSAIERENIEKENRC